jgi:hypothetical protein
MQLHNRIDREYANVIGKQLCVGYNLFPSNHLSLQNDRTSMPI